MRDEVNAWGAELDAIEGTLPTVDDLLDRIHRDADDGSHEAGSASA